MARMSATVLALCTGAALGQGTSPWEPRAWSSNPLGDGRILQRDLSILAPEVRARDFAAEARYRNAVVTGSAVGGVSFRGAVGYTDPLSFRGTLGSEDLFEFRRDSMISGLAGSGIRGTDALQYQFALTTGGVTPIGLAGTLTVQRGLTDFAARGGLERRGTGAVDSLTGVGALGISQAPEGASGTLRSLSSYQAGRSLIPGMVGYRLDAMTGRPEPVSASSVLGVQWWGLTDGERARGERRPLPSGLGYVEGDRPRTAFEEMRERLLRELGARGGGAVEPGAAPSPTGAPPASPGGLGVATPMSDAEARAREGLLMLRNRLTGLEDPSRLEGDGLGVVKSLLLGRQEGGLGRSRRPGSWTEAEEETIEAMREAASEPVSSLVGAGLESRDAFTVHASMGQRYLAEGRYFDAEERFARALVVRPGDPACLAGRMHAQLGAGMILSASLNLRELLAEHPATAPVRYGPELLPSAERQEALIAMLRENIAAGSLERPSGLLLAYLGYQRGERGLIEEGLSAFARVTVSAMPTQSEAQEARATMELTALLRRVWLGVEGER